MHRWCDRIENQFLFVRKRQERYLCKDPFARGSRRWMLSWSDEEHVGKGRSWLLAGLRPRPTVCWPPAWWPNQDGIWAWRGKCWNFPSSDLAPALRKPRLHTEKREVTALWAACQRSCHGACSSKRSHFGFLYWAGQQRMIKECCRKSQREVNLESLPVSPSEEVTISLFLWCVSQF